MNSRLLIINADAKLLRDIRSNLLKLYPSLVIDAAKSSRAAFNKLKKEHFDCILISVQADDKIPQEEIEALSESSDAPILLLNRQCSDNEFELALAAGADDCFIFDESASTWNRLLHLLRRVIKQHERDEEINRQQLLINTLATFDEEIAHLRTEELIGNALDFIVEKLNVFHASIVLPSEDGKDYLISDLRNSVAGLFRAQFIKSGEIAITRVIEGEKAVYRPDLEKEKEKYAIDKLLIEDGIRSDFLLPLFSGGRCMGALACASRERDGFPEGQRHALTLLAPRLAQSLRNAQLFAALGESEERFRAIFENATIGIYRTTPAGKILLANPVLLEMLGFNSFFELQQRNLEEHGFEPEYPREEFRRRIEEEGGIQGLESAWTRCDGGVIHVRESARAAYNDDGQILYYEGTVEDISDRKQMEISLQRESEIHEEMARLTQQLFGFTTHDEIAGIILESSRRLTGSTSGFAGYIDPDTGYLVCPTLAADIHRGDCEVPTRDYVFRNPGGVLGWVLKNKQSVLINNPDEDQRFGAIPKGHIKLERFLAAPAMTGEELVGMISLANADADYVERDIALVERLALIYAQAILRVRAEETLRQERRMFVRGPVVVFKWGAAEGWPVEYVSPNIEHCGFGVEDFVGGETSYLNMVHPDDRERIESEAQQNVEAGIDNFERAYRVIGPDGDVCWVRDTTTAIRDPEGRLSHYLGYVFNDTEHELAVQAVRESEEKYRLLFESELDAIMLVDAESDRLIDVNPAACRMYGYSKEEFLELSSTAISSEVDRTLEKLKGTPGKGAAFVPKRTHIRKDGSEFLVEASLGTFSTKGKKIICAIIRDISERVQAEEAVRDSRDRLEKQAGLLAATNRELESFAHTVSHDLQAPLRRISGWIKLLREEHPGGPDDQQGDFLRMIDNNSAEMRQLINALLEFSRTSRREIESIRVNLSIMAREAIRVLQDESPERQAKVEIEADVWSMGDPGLVKQVLENLIRNAWKFTSREEIARIEFGTAESQGKTAFYVRDNGVGFDPAKADKLFTAFQRLHTDSEFEGLGIGLATVQRIVHRHGGSVWAESEKGKGSTFYFTLG